MFVDVDHQPAGIERVEVIRSSDLPAEGDRRAALIAAIEVATNGDHRLPIATAVIAEFRKRNALLPSLHSIEKIGLGGRAIARRRAESAIVAGIALDRLASLDRLLEIDPAIGQTRFHWL